MHYDYRGFKVILELTPCLAALTLTSLLILVSDTLPISKKTLFNSSVFALAFAVSVTAVVISKDELQAFWFQFQQLSKPLRFALAVLVVTVSYFGGSFYACSPEESSGAGSGAALTPASCDNAVDFDVPDSLPRENLDLFEECLERFTQEIIADLPTVYEMPEEAVAWTHRMINYTVSGGKMNRGLAVMTVMEILMEEKGCKLSNKVSVVYNLSVYIGLISNCVMNI